MNDTIERPWVVVDELVAARTTSPVWSSPRREDLLRRWHFSSGSRPLFWLTQRR
ncbi:hypothetical protein HBB16_17800 [Pseudonocardia sp. MCCB 268]|nr:hypothetical protein [Pseudonocardia cytotoxica]